MRNFAPPWLGLAGQAIRWYTDGSKRKQISTLFMDPGEESLPGQPSTVKSDELALKADEKLSQTLVDTPSLNDLHTQLDDASQLAHFQQKDPEAQRKVPGTFEFPEGKKRYRLEVQFLGTKYYGWQRRALKATLPTVQDALEDTISAACDCNQVEIIGSTLLEAGIHCRNMTCHVDMDAKLEMPSQRVILQRCEKWLAKRGESIGVLSFNSACPGFHARFCAQRRTYVYRILNRIAPPLMDGKEMQWHVDRALNTKKMAEAAAVLQGTFDFSGFADHGIARLLAHKGESFSVRTLENIQVVRQADEVLIWFMGQSFLRHQIRNIVSCLHMVGLGLWTTDDILFILDRSFVKGRARDRTRPPTAPPCGLTLWEVSYDQSMYPRPEEYVQEM